MKKIGLPLLIVVIILVIAGLVSYGLTSGRGGVVEIRSAVYETEDVLIRIKAKDDGGIVLFLATVDPRTKLEYSTDNYRSSTFPQGYTTQGISAGKEYQLKLLKRVFRFFWVPYREYRLQVEPSSLEKVTDSDYDTLPADFARKFIDYQVKH
ncbi:MAG: hypothetical protein UMV23_01920 [Halanaerobium sp.]|nr:hypothetical protein [Halanaerobium sp.]